MRGNVRKGSGCSTEREIEERKKGGKKEGEEDRLRREGRERRVEGKWAEYGRRSSRSVGGGAGTFSSRRSLSTVWPAAAAQQSALAVDCLAGCGG